MLLLCLVGCENTSVSIGGQGHIDNPITGSSASVALTINTDGEVVLSENYSQDIFHIGEAGVGLTAGVETVLYDFGNNTNSLVILSQDESGNVWEKAYQIGESFDIAYNENRVIDVAYDPDTGNRVVAIKPTGDAPGYDDLTNDIQNLVVRWDRAHKAADGPNWDTSDLDTVLRNAALQEQLATVDSLRSRNCYWTIDELMTPQITRFDVNSSTSLLVEVRKNWDMNLYCDGRKSGDDDGYFTMRYEIERISGQWYITYKTVANRQ